MNQIIKISTALFLLVALASCKKYLDKKPANNIDVPTDLEDLQALLDNGRDINQNITPGFGEGASDDFFVLQQTYDILPIRDQDLYRWVPIEYKYPNDWSKNYLPVFVSNYCLELLQDISVNSKNRQLYENVKGTSLFYRAYFFSQLAWTFALAYDESTADSDYGIVLRLGADFNVPSTRSSIKETYEQIVKDAKESATYLPDLPEHTFRPSKAAAYGLLARVYLTMRKYDSAFKYANLSLNIKNDLIDYKTDIDVNASAPFDQFNIETLFYTEMNSFTSTTFTSRALVDTTLYASYTDNDLRKLAYFNPKNGYFSFKGSYTGTSTPFTGIATDEMYLIRAECYARSGDKENALKDLNTLLEKRYDATFTPVSAADAAEALTIILLERRKELYWRGLRFPDIKRLNKEGANIVLVRMISGETLTLPPNDNRYAIQIPRDIVDLTGIPQNPR
jgi:Osmosensitive K+ channel histidine kinase